MILATRIVLLAFTAFFLLSALGAKEERHRQFSLVGGTVIAALLLLSFRLF